jgi:capsular polysaccharide biosynthesis protein
VNERDTILKPLNLAVIQAVLLTIFVALVEFLIIPPAYASYVVFITLCVGAAAGIYLSNR